MLEPNLQLLFHLIIQFVLLAEFISERLRSVALIDDDLLDAILCNVDLNVELWVPVCIHRVGHLCLRWLLLLMIDLILSWRFLDLFVVLFELLLVLH